MRTVYVKPEAQIYGRKEPSRFPVQKLCRCARFRLKSRSLVATLICNEGGGGGVMVPFVIRPPGQEEASLEAAGWRLEVSPCPPWNCGIVVAKRHTEPCGKQPRIVTPPARCVDRENGRASSYITQSRPKASSQEPTGGGGA
jgi:hypothetical protein